ncbi:cytochrome P450 1A1-like [Littorina saxatilis]|uniref:unspecific monooxygenase n=1 Tax=Littorina saxatilis TaxID=31220 RepID=A0AAN9BWW8_9CAEN
MAKIDLNNVPASGFEMQVTAALLLAVSMLMVVLLFLFNKDSSKRPPGPRGVPVMGYLPFFDKEAHLTFTKLRETYGDVLSLSFGAWPAVVVSGYDVIKEALVAKGDDFSGRPAFTTGRMWNEGRSFGLGPFDAVWKMKQAIVKQAMAKFINAKTDLIEEVIRAEVGAVITSLTSHGDTSLCPKDSISVAISSMMYQLCYGRLDDFREDPGFKAELAGEMSVLAAKKGSLLDLVPWLRHVQRAKVNRFKDIVRDVEDRRSARITEHEATFDDENLRDLADFLIQAGNSLSEGDLAVGLDKTRVVESLDFIKQAHGSVGTALEWLLLLMAAYPEVQDKVFKEICDVVGRDRAPGLADRRKLSYAEATIMEGIRYAAPVPLAIPHSTTCDTKLQGFDIKQDTVVFFNLFSIYKDKDLWGDPEVFRPERFLTLEGELDKSLVERVTTFSMGRRSCIGASLACMELFLFFTTLMQRVKISRPSGQTEEYSMEGYYNPTRKPNPYQICVAVRDSQVAAVEL